MVASVRFWRAIRPHLPETPAGDALRLRLYDEPRIARKRHMPWDVPLTPEQARIVRRLMDAPPTPYVAFVVAHHQVDALARPRVSGDTPGHGDS